MRCPACGFNNRRGVKFCEECGARLELMCPSCGAQLPPAAKFCGECGEPLRPAVEAAPPDLDLDDKLARIQKYLPSNLTQKVLSQRNKIEGERRQVTIMFVDMKGFTELTEQLGADETFALMDQIFEILIHKIHDYEGTVNELRGDGVLALFGAPIALEDAPQRAIRSAQAIHREMTRFSEKIKSEKQFPSILLRIGINSGPVVVGTVGNDLRVQFTAVGDTINMAARMEQLAEPGTTYVTEETFKLCEGFFRFEALGERHVKGKDQPLKVYRVIATSARTTRFDVSAERGLARFVGRTPDLKRLGEGFEQCKAFQGRAFSIVGEAGTGKSRLLYEFRKLVANENATFLEGKCLSYGRAVPYLPVIDILKSVFRIGDDEDDATIREKVKGSLAYLQVDEASTLPHLLTLLTVDEKNEEIESLGPEKRREGIVEALKRVVFQSATIRPLILAIEDLHWIDGSSQYVVHKLLEGISRTRVLVLLTYRPEFSVPWKSKSYHSQITLRRLSDADSLEIVTYLVGSDQLSSDLEDLILEKTEGIPLFIEEMVRSLKDLGMSQGPDSKYYLVRSILQPTIPATIQDIIMHRVDSLPHEAREVLQIGSVIGREFDYELMRVVTKTEDEELLRRLDLLKESELVYERGVHPKSTYILRHALVEDVCYQSLLKSTRQKCHRNVAQALTAHFPQTLRERPEIPAHHFTAAGMPEQAIPYWQQAGLIAIRRSANPEAISHFETALELLKTIPSSPENVRREIDLQIALGPALMAIKGYTAPEVQRAYARAHELCKSVGDTPELLTVLRGLWGASIVRGDLRLSQELAERSLRLAQKSENPSLYLWAQYTSGLTHTHRGEFTQARQYFEEGRRLYFAQKRRSRHALQDPGVACLSYLTVTLWALGYPDQAMKTGLDAVNLARELSHPFSLAYTLSITSLVCQLYGAVRESKERADEADALCTEYEIPYWKAWGPILSGRAVVEAGRFDEGIGMTLSGLAAYRATGARLVQPHFLCLLAQSYGKAGRVLEGLQALQEALDLMKETEECWCETEVHRTKGELLIALGPHRWAEAEGCFQNALEIARRQDAKSWELRAATSLSRMWKEQGKPDEAGHLLSGCYEWFTEGFDSDDLRRARDLLDALE